MHNSERSRGRRTLTHLVFTLLLIIGVSVSGLALLSWTAVRPTNLGVNIGRLADCPDAPNCVSTQGDDHQHWIAPLNVLSQSTPPIAVLADILSRMPRTTIVQQNDHYLYAEFRSQIFRFCDDVEFFFEPETKRVHFRSASRVGRSDLGVNRERMEIIRVLFKEAVRTQSRAGDRPPSSGDAVSGETTESSGTASAAGRA